MSELSQFIIVMGFGALCFGCGFLVAFIWTRNKWRDEMIKRGVARYNWQTGKWEWGSRHPSIKCLPPATSFSARLVLSTP